MEKNDNIQANDNAAQPCRNAVDLKKLKQDTGLSIQDIASAIGMKESRNIYKWSYLDGGTRPSYDTIIRLMELGASPEAIFGRPWPRQERPSEIGGIASSEEFKAGVREALAEILNIRKETK